MLSLGYNEYGTFSLHFMPQCSLTKRIYLVTQGGDWGHLVRTSAYFDYQRLVLIRFIVFLDHTKDSHGIRAQT